MANILILEDSDDSYYIIDHLLNLNHNLTRAKTVNEAKQKFDDIFQLLILDVGLPDGDGYEFCHWVRAQKQSELPVIFVSAKTSTESCIAGFSSGGDDYIYKPFHPSEFTVRVNSKLRAQNIREQKSYVLEANGVKIDLTSQKAFIYDGNSQIEIDLTPIEFKILKTFLQSPDKAIPRDDILDKVWGKDIYVYPRSVDTHVSKLRKKLGQKGNMIISVHGRGYRFKSENDKDTSQQKQIVVY